ncbi:hypothetical protein [Bailinhaonella thermotolerans]|uniref:Uncharacterized protein n=1 Tax=Bailinhaonella thermotolerans TaxID=1070861 RepID=A0A3A4BD87_9ACTN|nr:hypothetical protein [Bailinhaonella thermotolerans]RJL32168.1 hypothetical protein D5H75_17310 [Bailinhaonella thermotolerans]
MAIDWSRAEILDLAREFLLGEGAVTDGYTGVDVAAEGDRLVVTFRWRRDPNTYAIEEAFPTEPRSPWTGMRVNSAREWVGDVWSRMREELKTGLVCRSTRSVRDGHVLLNYRGVPRVTPAGYYIDAVPLDRLARCPSPPHDTEDVDGDGEVRHYVVLSAESLERIPLAPSETGTWPAAAGMDVAVPRRRLAEGTLACWLQAYVDNADGEPVAGHVVMSWEDEGRTVARLDLAHIQPGVPSEVRAALVHFALCVVIEEGALRVVTALDFSALRELGFRPGEGAGLALHTRLAPSAR